MSIQPSKDKSDKPDINNTIYGNGNDTTSSKTPARIDGLGNLLFHMHSVHLKPILFAKEETSLQFYEHVVIATTVTQLWCFPKKVWTEVIPRFKIVDAYFTLGPRRVHWLFWWLLLFTIFFITFGALFGGCKETETYSYYGSSSATTKNSGACGTMVIGILLIIPMLLLLFIPCCFKLHYVYLDVKTPLTRNCCFFKSKSYETLTYRFKKFGFDHTTDDKAVFDEFYLVDYVYGSFSNASGEVMDEAHLLSHFNHARLANPIDPHHIDESIRDLVLSTNLAPNNSHTSCLALKNGSSGHEEEEVAALGTRITYLSPKNVDV